jgi:hypothetical protein
MIDNKPIAFEDICIYIFLFCLNVLYFLHVVLLLFSPLVNKAIQKKPQVCKFLWKEGW